MDTVVECLSSATYAQRPLAFTWQGQRLIIEEVLSEWRRPGENCFRVRTTTGQVFDLIWNENADGWHIQPL